MQLRIHRPHVFELDAQPLRPRRDGQGVATFPADHRAEAILANERRAFATETRQRPHRAVVAVVPTGGVGKACVAWSNNALTGEEDCREWPRAGCRQTTLKPMISIRSTLVLAVALATASLVHSAQPAVPQFVSIFNGKDLTGWKPDGDPSIWSADQGELVGRSNAKREGSTISTEKKYHNFILELDFKYLPPADSGVIFRAPELQMQIGTSASLRTELTGSFYLGGVLTYTNDSISKDAWKYFFPGDWNSLRLQAQGAVFTVWINGQIVNRYVDDKFPGAAPISLQVHQNFDMKVEFKNIRIAELK